MKNKNGGHGRDGSEQCKCSVLNETASKYGQTISCAKCANPTMTHQLSKSNAELMTEFDKKQRLFLNGKYHSTQFNKWFEEEVLKSKDAERERAVEEATHCKKLVENGEAICGCKLDCHLHDWRQREEIEKAVEEVVQKMCKSDFVIGYREGGAFKECPMDEALRLALTPNISNNK